MKKKILRATWPRVYWTPKRGRLQLCVDSRKVGFPSGRREFWNTPAEALAAAEAIARQKENEGAASFAELSPAERRDAAEALAHLNGSGTLLDAARLFVRETERQRSLAHVPNVSEAIDAYVAAKRAEESRGEITRLTLWDIQSKRNLVRAHLGALKVTEIDEALIHAFLRKLPQRPQGKAAIKTKLSQFLSYCKREGKWIASNPAQDVKVRFKNAEVKILSVDEARRLLSCAQGTPDVMPYLVVQLFGGLRPYEAARLRWDRIDFETRQLEVLSHTSKTRETRFVQMEGALIEWLLPYRKAHGSIIGPSLREDLRQIKRLAGLYPWPKGVLRHCYGSYWLALHKDRAQLAELMGNSPAVIKAHYKRAIPQTQAEKFWVLRPLRASAQIIDFGVA